MNRRDRGSGEHDREWHGLERAELRPADGPEEHDRQHGARQPRRRQQHRERDQRQRDADQRPPVQPLGREPPPAAALAGDEARRGRRATRTAAAGNSPAPCGTGCPSHSPRRCHEPGDADATKNTPASTSLLNRRSITRRPDMPGAAHSFSSRLALPDRSLALSSSQSGMSGSSPCRPRCRRTDSRSRTGCGRCPSPSSCTAARDWRSCRSSSHRSWSRTPRGSSIALAPGRVSAWSMRQTRNGSVSPKWPRMILSGDGARTRRPAPCGSRSSRSRP